MNFLRDFISEENRDFKFKLGKTIASSLTGFVAGLIVATILWFLWFNASQMVSTI